MSVELLRRAAALMYGRAGAASSAPWEARIEGDVPWVGSVVDFDFTSHLADVEYDADAAYIASWHPAVTLAVADWLDGFTSEWAIPDDLEEDEEPEEHHFGNPMCGNSWFTCLCGEKKRALAVARAYLGEESA